MAGNNTTNNNSFSLIPISGLTLLIILCIGEPDLLDALTQWVFSLSGGK